MELRRRTDSTSQSCSCTSCLYKIGCNKFSVRRYIAQDSRASRLYFEKYIPLREQKLLNRFVRTGAVIDDLKSRLVCDSILDPEKNTYLRPGKSVTNSLNSEQHGVLELDDIFDKGAKLDAKLSKCCSRCRFLLKVKILGVENELKHKKESARRYEGITRQIGKRENIYVSTYERKIGKTERGKMRERYNKKGIRFKAKYIRSDPCTCTLKYSGLIKKQSKTMIKQIHHVPYVLNEPVNLKKQNFTRKSYQNYKNRLDKLEQDIKIINEYRKNVTQKIQFHSKQSLGEVKHVKNNIKINIESSVSEIVQNLKALKCRHKDLESLQYPEESEMKNYAIVKLNDDFERKDVIKFLQCNIEREPETSVPDDIIKIKKLKRYCHNYTAKHKMFNREMKLGGTPLSKSSSGFKAKKIAKTKRARVNQLMSKLLKNQYEEVNKVSMKDEGRPQIAGKSVDFGLSATYEEYESLNSKEKNNIKSINNVLNEKLSKAVLKTEELYLCDRAVPIKSQYNFDVEFFKETPKSKTFLTSQPSEIYKNTPIYERREEQHKKSKVLVKPSVKESIGITQKLNARLIQKDELGDSEIVFKSSNLVLDKIQSEKSLINIRSNTSCGNKSVSNLKNSLVTMKKNLSTFVSSDSLIVGSYDIFSSQKPALRIVSKFPFKAESYKKSKENENVSLTNRKIKETVSSFTIKEIYSSRELVKVHRTCIKACRDAKSTLHRCFCILKLHRKGKIKKKNKKSTATITITPPPSMMKYVGKKNNYDPKMAEAPLQPCKCVSDIGIRKDCDPIFGKTFKDKNTSKSVGFYVNYRKTKSTSGIVGKTRAAVRYRELINFGQNKIQKTNISMLGGQAVRIRSGFSLNIEFRKNRLALSASDKPSMSNTAREMKCKDSKFKNGGNQGSSFRRRLFASCKNKLNKKYMLQNTQKLNLNTQTFGEVAISDTDDRSKKERLYKLLPFERRLYNYIPRKCCRYLPRIKLNTQDNCIFTVKPEMTEIPCLTDNNQLKYEGTLEHPGLIPSETNIESMYSQPKSPYFVYARGSGEVINATKAKQAVKVRSQFKFSIELSKRIPGAVELARYPKKVKIQKQLGKDEGKSVWREPGPRKRAALVGPKLKRCFCTLNLQKKNRNQHYTSNLNLPSAITHFGPNAVGRAMTAETQFISQKIRLEGDRKCQFFRTRNKIMSISASSFLLNKHMNSFQSKYSNLKIYSIFKTPEQFKQPLTTKSNLSMTVKIIRKLDFCNVPTLCNRKNSLETFSHLFKNAHDSLRLIDHESHPGQKKITGIGRYLERNFCTMNVKISNTAVPPSVDDISNKIKPYECECQCDLYERKKHVRTQYVKNANKCSGTHSENKVISRTLVGDHPQMKREAVRVGSSFSFSMEFFKTQSDPSENYMKQHKTRSDRKRPLGQNEYRTISKGCQGKRIKRNDSEDRGSQRRIQRLDSKQVQKTPATVDKASGALKNRGHCTFKLQKRGRINKERATLKHNDVTKPQTTKLKNAKISTETKYQKKLIDLKNPNNKKCTIFKQNDVTKPHKTKPKNPKISTETKNQKKVIDLKTPNNKECAILKQNDMTKSQPTKPKNAEISTETKRQKKVIDSKTPNKKECAVLKQNDMTKLQTTKPKTAKLSTETKSQKNLVDLKNPKCCEYELGVQVPEDGIPYKYSKQMKKHKDIGSNMKIERESVSSTTSQGHSKTKYKTRSVDTKRNTNHKRTNAVKYNGNTHPPTSEPNSRQVVRIESNFSFNIEIFKDTSQFKQQKENIKQTTTGKSKINPMKEVTSCACQSAKVHSDKNINVKIPHNKAQTATEPKLHSIEIRNKRNTTSFIEKCFCWLGLQKRGNKDNPPTKQVEKKSNRNNDKRYTGKAAQTTEILINKKNRQKGPVSGQFAPRILDQCDPYLCNEIIKKSNVKHDSKGSGDELVQTQSSSFRQRKRSKNERIQVESQPNTLKQKQHRSKTMPSGKMINNNDELDKRLVRIGSNISFNIEFYKDNFNDNNINDNTKGVKPSSTKKCHLEKKEKGIFLKSTTTESTQKTSNVRSNESQVSKEYRTSGINPLLKSCFCNLDIKNTQIDQLDQTNKNSQKDIKPTIIAKSVVTQSKGEKFKNHQDIPQNLSLYEHEPFVYVPDEYAHVQCLKRIKKKLEQTKDYGVATDYPKSKSIGSISTSVRDENVQTNITSGVTKLVRKTNQIGESYNRPETFSNQSRQAVRIGSNFSFNIEFYKGFGDGKPQIEVMQQQSQDKHKYSKKVLQRQAESQLYNKNKSDQPKSDQSSVGKFLRKCVCTLGLNKIGKLQNRLPTPAVQYKIKSTSTDSRRIPKDRIDKLTQILERYEKERYFYVPRETRQVRDFGTNTNRNLKDSATYSVREPMTKSTKVQCHRYCKLNSRGTYFSKSHRDGKEVAQYYPHFSPNIDKQGQKYNLKQKQHKSKIKPFGKVIINDNESDKRVVRIGSNFSFNVEFCKENLKTNIDIPDKTLKREPKFRTRSKKIQGKPRGFITRACPTYKSAQSQSLKNRKKNSAANTVPKICLCKQKLLKNTKSPKSKLKHQPKTIKTKDKLIATKVKYADPRASGVPNLTHSPGKYDRNDSLDKMDVKEIIQKFCVVGTRPEKTSTGYEGTHRYKLKADKNQYHTAKQSQSLKNRIKNSAANTVPKICLCKQKQLKNTKPPKSKLKHQPKTIKTKDTLIATKVKCGVSRASGVPNLRHSPDKYDSNDSLDKMNKREIFQKSCVVGTRPEKTSTVSVGTHRYKIKAHKNQSPTAKQRNTGKHKNVGARTGIFRHNNIQMDSVKLNDQSSDAGSFLKKCRCTVQLQKSGRQKENEKSCKRKSDAVYPQKFTVRTAFIKPFHKDLKTCPLKERVRVRSIYNNIYLRNTKSNMHVILPHTPSKVERRSSKNLDDYKFSIGFSGQGKRISTAKKTKKSKFANKTMRKSKENTSLLRRFVKFFTHRCEGRPKDSGLQKDVNKMYDNYQKPTRLKSCLVPKMGNHKTTRAIFGENCFYICPNKIREPSKSIFQSVDADYNINKIDNDQSKKRERGPKLHLERPKMHVTFADIMKNCRNDIFNGKIQEVKMYKSKTGLCCSCLVNDCPHTFYNLKSGHQIIENFHVFGKNKMNNSKKIVSYSESVNECQYSMCFKRKLEVDEICKGSSNLLCKRDTDTCPNAIEFVNVNMCKRYSGPCIGESKKCALELKRKKNKRSFVKQGETCERVKKCSNAGDVIVSNLGMSTVRNAINCTAKSISDLKVSCEKCNLSKKRDPDLINKTSQKIQEGNIESYLAATAKRTKMRCILMKTKKSPQQRLKKNPMTHINTQIADKHPKTRQLKWIRRVREPVDFQYSYYMASLRKRRHFNFIFKCPWLCSHFHNNMFSIWKKITNVMLFLLSVVMWSPCILYRAMLCCFFCSGAK